MVHPAWAKIWRTAFVLTSMTTEQSRVEILTREEFAEKLKVLPSWVREMSKPSRTSDPIPVIRLGKHVRYKWGSKPMEEWLARRAA
jgi:hypothetical protein